MQEIHFPELPYYIKVYKQVDKKNDSVSIHINGTIYVRKWVILPGTFSQGYIAKYPKRFRGEVLSRVIRRYGLKAEPTRYS